MFGPGNAINPDRTIEIIGECRDVTTTQGHPRRRRHGGPVMTNNRRTQLRALLSRMRARYTIPTEPPPPDPRHRDRAGRTPLHYAVTDDPR